MRALLAALGSAAAATAAAAWLLARCIRRKQCHFVSELHRECYKKTAACFPLIAQALLHTPAKPLQFPWFQGSIWAKLESIQVTGSFKARGALSKVSQMTIDELKAGVYTASAGNHALGVVHATKFIEQYRQLPCVSAKVYLPGSVTEAKEQRLRALNAEVTIAQDKDIVETEGLARTEAERNGGSYISPYNDLDVAAGQGTVALELLNDHPDVQDILVPVGGGGLASGIAAYVKAVSPHVRVWGVQPVVNACMKYSIDAGRIKAEGEYEDGATWSDGTAGGIEEGSITFSLCRELLDGVLLVSEETIKGVCAEMLTQHHLIIEGSSALGFGAVKENPRMFESRKVAVIVTGSNMPTSRLVQLLEMH